MLVAPAHHLSRRLTPAPDRRIVLVAVNALLIADGPGASHTRPVLTTTQAAGGPDHGYLLTYYGKPGLPSGHHLGVVKMSKITRRETLAGGGRAVAAAAVLSVAAKAALASEG